MASRAGVAKRAPAHAARSPIVEIGECRSRRSTRYVATTPKPTSTPPWRFAQRARRGTASQIRREGFCSVASQQQEEHREEREREQLRTHDEERGGGGDDNADEHHRADSVMGLRASQVERERGERDPDGDGLREDETLVAELGLETVEDELAERGRVLPVRRRGSVRDRVRQRSGANDYGSDGGEPARIGADDGGESCRGATESCGDPRQTDGRPGGVGVHISHIGRSGRELHSFRCAGREALVPITLPQRRYARASGRRAWRWPQ